MKKNHSIWIILLAVVGLLGTSRVQAQESLLAYYMPKTDLQITLTYECVEQEPGVFYQYAQRYLGTTEVVNEKKVEYQIKNIEVGTTASADTSRLYYVPASLMQNMPLISMTEDGRLLGYNCGLPACQPAVAPVVEQAAVCYQPSLMPLLEEQFLAGSVTKMAEGAAKLIYRIRETRLQILAGDVENVPADGKAMQLVLEELNKQEQQLVELFVGKTTVSTHTSHFSYTPDKSVENTTIGRFSKHAGMVDINDLSGEPIFLSLIAHEQVSNDTLVVEKKGETIGALYYNLPGSADVTISYKDEMQVSAQVAVAQYGKAQALSKALFATKPKLKLLINPETGNILSIQQ
jgi:hypothetical protein